ncbi:MAG TPA: hypothetical protein VGO58_08410 [Chitinophagaceae bacterium]|nr:hypothetical protein [Chitinophagaceae bacterium]
MLLGTQIVYLLVLAIPVACISWTVTHEEVFREPREYCVRHSKENRYLLVRKFFYLFTCEYCFSHYITIGMLLLTDYHLLFENWRGLLIGGFSMVWVANIYMSLFYMIRIDIKKDKTIIEKIADDPVPEKNKLSKP